MKERRKHQRETPEKYLAVFDSETDRQIGDMANLSEKGAMFITPTSVKPGTIFTCRVPMPRNILGWDEIVFEAECRWCRKNIETGEWESGYKLHATGVNSELISYLVLSLKLGDWGDKDIPDVKTVEMDNRRKSTRYEFGTSFPVFERDSYRQLGELADLSIHGARLISPKPIKKKSVIPFRVLLPKEVFQQKYLIFDAECMWCRKWKDGKRYESGYEIVDISEDDAVIILHLLIHYSTTRQTEKRIKIAK